MGRGPAADSSSISTARPAFCAASMIDDAGGWQHDTLTEDSDLSYRAQLKGWQFVYMPGRRVPVGTAGGDVRLPGAAIALGQGLDAGRMKLLPTILKADLPRRVKLEAFFHLTPNISYPLMIVVSALMLPVMIVRFYMGWLQMLFIDLPLIIASFWSISAFYVLAHRELFPRPGSGLSSSCRPDGGRSRTDSEQHAGRD